MMVTKNVNSCNKRVENRVFWELSFNDCNTLSTISFFWEIKNELLFNPQPDSKVINFFNKIIIKLCSFILSSKLNFISMQEKKEENCVGKKEKKKKRKGKKGCIDRFFVWFLFIVFWEEKKGRIKQKKKNRGKKHGGRQVLRYHKERSLQPTLFSLLFTIHTIQSF